ncbi:MAG: Oligopeptide transport substrate-binding protein @ Glutathione ABC transporter, substrate-binding protein GsiB [uncultured Paraburkholderia sp.]|nr:MAG: Oligopeptide transport substrate-binding protein @ Glutathione ABC transporter, substrate-binding protein GsiB [uncultured Paraburkholderia sp.]CAH2917138.1 MAG: Oligopeptide transport substrate-binding protein @ Glutathione ABC transporter, substrate-binding protein GsiB [uncultured Paraburkholderia sp.]
MNLLVPSSPFRLRALLGGGAVVFAMLAGNVAHAESTAVMAVASTLTTLDPYDANDTLSQAVAKSFYQGLFGFDKDMKLVNVLADSYEASPDARIHTFKLRHGVKFQDGTDFNAAAVKANFDRVTDPANKLKRYNMFDNPKVREALNYAVNKEALTKVVFGGYATPADGVVPQGVDYAVKLGPWPYDPAKARALLKEAGYPNGFETTLWSAYKYSTAQKVIQFVQQQLAQVGIKAQVEALEAGQRVAKVESAQDAASAPVRMYYAGWSSSTGEADWAITPLLASVSFPPKMVNTAYYRNDTVDGDLKEALETTDRTKKAALYTDAQKRIWADAPWIFLVKEKVVYARSKRLSGAYVAPDGSFNFDEIAIK